MSFNSKYTGRQVEELLDKVAEGNRDDEKEVVYLLLDDSEAKVHNAKLFAKLAELFQQGIVREVTLSADTAEFSSIASSIFEDEGNPSNSGFLFQAIMGNLLNQIILHSDGSYSMQTLAEIGGSSGDSEAVRMLRANWLPQDMNNDFNNDFSI